MIRHQPNPPEPVERVLSPACCELCPSRQIGMTASDFTVDTVIVGLDMWASRRRRWPTVST
jgi:hypothetical protein